MALALTDAQLTPRHDGRGPLPVEKRSVLVERVAAHLGSLGYRRVRDSDVESAVRVALRGLVHEGDYPAVDGAMLRQADASLSGKGWRLHANCQRNCADWRSRIWHDLHSGHKAHPDQRENQGIDRWRNGGLVIRILRIDGNRNSNQVGSGDHHIRRSPYNGSSCHRPTWLL